MNCFCLTMLLVVPGSVSGVSPGVTAGDTTSLVDDPVDDAAIVGDADGSEDSS